MLGVAWIITTQDRAAAWRLQRIPMWAEVHGIFFKRLRRSVPVGLDHSAQDEGAFSYVCALTMLGCPQTHDAASSEGNMF